jgi:hypothetical protein
MLMVTAWLDAGGPDNDTQDDDEDLKSDPIAQIDLPVSPPTIHRLLKSACLPRCVLQRHGARKRYHVKALTFNRPI